MYKFLPLTFVLFIFACSSPPLDMSEEEIDAYIASVVDPEKIYDIRESLRFSKDDEAYEVTEYSNSDSVILYLTEYTTETDLRQLYIYYKDGFPVYIEEYYYEFPQEYYKVTERKIYLNGEDVMVAYERTANTDEGIEEAEFEEKDVPYTNYDLSKPKDALAQNGEFEMKFGEFLVINPDSYLILDNNKSGWGAALYIIEGDMLLDNLFENPDAYQGKTIEVHHEFMIMNGIERMIYRGGILKE